jgi:hypothetical protein
VKIHLYIFKESYYSSEQTGSIFNCLKLREVSRSVTSQVLSQRRTPNLKTKDVCNILSSQGYCKSQGEMIDEHRAIME